MLWLLVFGGQEQGSRLCVRDEGSCSTRQRTPATKALRTICGSNRSIVSSSWGWDYKCPKHVEQIISAIKHSSASSWFSSLRLYNDSRTNIHKKHNGIFNIKLTFFCTTSERNDLNVHNLRLKIPHFRAEKIPKIVFSPHGAVTKSYSECVMHFDLVFPSSKQNLDASFLPISYQKIAERT